MKIQHPPSHWIMVALVLAALLLTFTEAHGQSGAAALFEGRPALAGAQGGMGAQAGVPQGGLAVQGNVASERSVRPASDPSELDQMRQARRNGEDMVAAAEATSAISTDATLNPNVARKEVAPGRDQSLAKDQRSAKKAQRAAKRTLSRARHGNAPIDAAKAR